LKRYFNKELLRVLIIADEKPPKQISKKIGVHYSSLWNWQQGGMPWKRHLKKLADYFKVDINEFYKSQDDSEYNQKILNEYKERYFK